MAQKSYNEDFVKILGLLEDIMTRQGEPFRAKAYQKASETIMKYPETITDISQIEKLQGIGKTIISKLEEYIKTGKVSAIEKYNKDPLNILTKVYGIGPKKAKDLINQGIDTIEKLREHREELTAAQKIGVEYYDDINKRIPREEIDIYINILKKVFKENAPENSYFEVVGSYRRGAVSSGDIDIIITNNDNNEDAYIKFLDALLKYKLVIHLLSRGKTKSLTLAQLPNKPARRIDFMYTPPEQYSFAILYFTGSKAFNTVQRQRALDLGYTLNEHGFSHIKNGIKGNLIECNFPDEQSIFRFLKMKYKSPQERIDGRSIEIVETNENKKIIKKTKRFTLKKKPETKITDLINDYTKYGVKYLNILSEKHLSEIIQYLNNLYYIEGTTIISDEQYDILREYTEQKYPSNKIAKEGHKNCDMKIQRNKVKLPYEMWSMDKIKPDTDALMKWSCKYNGPYVYSCKLDGVSGLYSTENETLKLYTRGNGIVGQDISYLIPYLKLPKENGLVIRGEFIIKKEVFKEKYSSEFANPRNYVAGLINQVTIHPEKINDIDFVAYEIIKPELKPSLQLKLLNKLNIKTVKNIVSNDISNELLSNLLVEWRENYDYEIDGVICTNDEIYERISGNPEHAFAFKMVLGEQIAEVKVIDVLWTPSKDGYLKPRVQIEPIILGGVKIEYATGFNAKFIVDNNIGVGSIVKLVRSGDVIPHIMSIIKQSDKPLLPNVHYKWNNTNVDIELINKMEDEIVQEKVITGFFKIIGVDGLGLGNIKRIMKSGYNTVPKILAMKQEDFLEVDGFKLKMAEKIYSGIHNKLNEASLPEIMQATNIFGRGFGIKRFKAILEVYPKILITKESINEKIIMINQINGMANKTSENFVNNIKPFTEWMIEAKLIDRLIYTLDETKNEVISTHPLYNKKIVMTGFRDKDLIAEIEKYGGELSGSVSKNTCVVLVKNIDEDTGKAEQARKLDIPIMTPEMFKEKFQI